MIDILLSTYNGEKYLSELLDSLLNQSYSEWKLWIRDDGSSDSTVRILDHYRRSYPEQNQLDTESGGKYRCHKIVRNSATANSIGIHNVLRPRRHLAARQD